jgi:hypothetical protein
MGLWLCPRFRPVGPTGQRVGLPGRRVEQYFGLWPVVADGPEGLSHLHQGAHRARFTTLIKNAIEAKIRPPAPLPARRHTGQRVEPTPRRANGIQSF